MTRRLGDLLKSAQATEPGFTGSSHNMMDAIMALLGAAITVAACYSAGALLLDRLGVKLYRQVRPALAFVVGAACLHLVVFAVLAAQVGYRAVVIAVPVLV